MKYDVDGIPCGFDEIEHIPRFIESKDADDYFQRLADELPWQEITLMNGMVIPRLVFRYGEFERSIRKYDILEELTQYVEEILETGVVSMWCNLYRNGLDHTLYNQNNYNSHVFILSFGNKRNFQIHHKENSNQQQYCIDHGDAFYFTPNINKKYEHTILKDENVKDIQISVIFFIDEPYIRRKYHFRHINLLGIGQIPVWFGGPASQFPQGTVATILPIPTGGLLAGARPEFGTLIGFDSFRNNPE